MNTVLKLALHALVATALIGGAVWALNHTAAPFGWIGLATSALSIQFCIVMRAQWGNALALSLGAVALTIAMYEFVLARKAPDHAGTEYTPADAMYQRSDLLGYGPRASVDVHARRTWRDQTLFDVHYGIDAQARRRVPAAGTAKTGPCLLLFGGSFAFGEGLEDAQTMANRLAEHSRGHYRIVNFGFPGYGPHQMLAFLQSPRAHSLFRDCGRTTGIYMGIAQHVARVSGRTSWDVHGPRYRLDSNGAVVRAGHFDDGARGWLLRLRREALKSRLYRSLFPLRLAGPFSQPEIARYAAVVIAAQRQFLKLAGPDARFATLLWSADFFSEPPQSLARITAALKSRGLAPLLIDADVLGGPPRDFRIHEREQHPNAQANTRVADWLFTRLTLRARSQDDD